VGRETLGPVHPKLGELAQPLIGVGHTALVLFVSIGSVNSLFYRQRPDLSQTKRLLPQHSSQVKHGKRRTLGVMRREGAAKIPLSRSEAAGVPQKHG
jgi:hypothetical protein